MTEKDIQNLDDGQTKVGKEQQYEVFDMNAQPGAQGARTHQIIVGRHPRTGEPIVKNYSLRSDEATLMPMGHAMQFLKDDAFGVYDAKGNRIEPVRDNNVKARNLGLATDEVVAVLDELTIDALYKRCRLHAGAEHIKKNTSKKTMVDFLIETAEESRTEGVSPGSEDKAAEMDGDTLDGMMGNLIDTGAQAAAG